MSRAALNKWVKIDSDGRIECWNKDETITGKCGICPACYGWVYEFETTDYKFTPIKEKSFRLWG